MTLDPDALYQLKIAGILLPWSLALYGWTRLRTTARAGILHDGARITAFGAVCYLVAAFGSSLGVSWRSQTLIYNLCALPFIIAVAYIVRVLASNQAKKWPALEATCRAGPYLLIASWLLTVVYGLYEPAPLLNRSGSMPEQLALLESGNVLEAFFLATSAVVFAKEALRRHVVPSPALRIQHAVLCVGSVCFSVLVLNLFTAALAEARLLPVGWNGFVASLHHPVLLTTLIVGGLAYSAGLFLYESAQENNRIALHLRKWIRHRHDLELDFDAAGGNKVGNALTDAYFRKAALDDTLQMCPRERDSAAYVVKLLRHIHRSPHARAPEIAALARLQSDLTRVTDVASRLFVKVEGNVQYDIRQDTLYAATTPALVLAQTKAKPSLLGQPDWVQLAAVTAADAGYLPEHKARLILDPASSSVRRTVLEAYTFAKLTEEEI